MNGQKPLWISFHSGFLYNENHAIVAWFKKRLTDEQKIIKRGFASL